MSDRIGHHCGIALVRLLKSPEHFRRHYGSAAWGLARVYLLLEKQRNRGQDGAGIACVNLDAKMGEPVYRIKRAPGRDAIDTIFSSFGAGPQAGFNEPGRLTADDQESATLADFTTHLYLGHVRYGTAGDNSEHTCHPQARHSNWPSRTLILAGNFNLTNADDLFQELIGYGQHPVVVNDTMTIMEKIGHFLDRENDRLYHAHGPESAQPLEGQALAARIGEQLDLVRVLTSAAKRWDGGYVFCGMLGHGDSFVCRDSVGIRPCFYVHHEDYFAVASERAALVSVFDVSPRSVRELQPGHCVIIKRDGRVMIEPFIESARLAATPTRACSFERIYFSRGNDADIYQERKNLGRNLAERVLDAVDWDVDHTVFSYIPNTSETAFLGLVQEAERLVCMREAERMAQLVKRGEASSEEIAQLFSERLRVEKIAHKDQKLRTFIADEAYRGALVSHAYDVTPGIVGPDDSLVVVDDSIVRGTTLRDSIILMLTRLRPKRIVVVSSAPPIKYPDCYGIDMSELQRFVAFQAAVVVLRDNGEEQVLEEVHRRCIAQQGAPLGEYENHVRLIYDRVSDEDLAARIARIVRPPETPWTGELRIVYQSINGLHAALPDHTGDWYFTGDYPTQGGYRVLNTSYINAHEGRAGRAY
ncbi:MAG: hypothetical protein KAS72_02275 [Phycisphaerales bacterium]|nr:hypothetical protein [Phycisphaerales bacterium]